MHYMARGGGGGRGWVQGRAPRQHVAAAPTGDTADSPGDATGDATAAAAPRARASPCAVVAGEDFVVVLSAGGRLWDSRHMATHRHPGVKLGDVGALLDGRVITQVAAGEGYGFCLGGQKQSFLYWSSDSFSGAVIPLVEQ